jgi:hypothetical protein
MPGGDGTGPRGVGPMTGRAAGYCAGFPVPGFANPIPGGLAPGRVGAYGAAGYPYTYGAYGYPYSGVGAPGGYGTGLPSAPYYGGFMRPRLGLGIGRGRGMGIGRGIRRRW